MVVSHNSAPEWDSALTFHDYSASVLCSYPHNLFYIHSSSIFNKLEVFFTSKLILQLPGNQSNTLKCATEMAGATHIVQLLGTCVDLLWSWWTAVIAHQNYHCSFISLQTSDSRFNITFSTGCNTRQRQLMYCDVLGLTCEPQDTLLWKVLDESFIWTVKVLVEKVYGVWNAVNVNGIGSQTPAAMVIIPRKVIMGKWRGTASLLLTLPLSS